MTDRGVEFELAALLEIVCAAIEIGDWKVDGRCDPDIALHRAAQALRNRGWRQNSINDSWMQP